jgi:hypothetical protein
MRGGARVAGCVLRTDQRRALHVPRKLTRSATWESLSSLGMRRGPGAGMTMGQLRVAHRGMGCRDAVAHHLLQRGELPGMHVGRPAGDAAKPWSLEGPLQRRVGPDHQAKFAEQRPAVAAHALCIAADPLPSFGPVP